MAHIIFYEKPGCINNTRQKQWLQAAGHEVRAVDILKHPWSKETLVRFFGNQPVSEWFNLTAPVIKSGELDPESFTAERALEIMQADPILIKRPLMNIDNTHFLQGFDKAEIHELIGLDAREGEEEIVKELQQTDLTVCPNLGKDRSCDDNGGENRIVRPLGEVIQLVEEMSLEVTYAYDDLVFISHNAFMFQFLENQIVGLYFNQDCPASDAGQIEARILDLAVRKGLSIERKGIFTMRQKDGEENLEIEFIDDPKD